MKSTEMGGEFRESHVRGDMAAGKREGAARLCGPEFDIEEGAGVTGLSRQTEFSFAHGRRVAEGISEGPDWPFQRALDLELAFQNLAARFFVAAEGQNRMSPGVRSDGHSSLGELFELGKLQQTPAFLA